MITLKKMLQLGIVSGLLCIMGQQVVAIYIDPSSSAALGSAINAGGQLLIEGAKKLPVAGGFGLNNQTGQEVAIVCNGENIIVKPGLHIIKSIFNVAGQSYQVSLVDTEKFRFKGLDLKDLGSGFTVPARAYWTVYIVKK